MGKLVALHGRDHRPEGADPIPGLLTLAGLAESVVSESPGATLVTAGATYTWPWGHDTGDALLDYTTSTAPTVVADGWYAIRGQLAVLPTHPTDFQADFAVAISTAIGIDLGFQPTGWVGTSTATEQVNIEGFCSGFLSAGDVISGTVVNHSGSDCDYSAALTVTKLA